MTPLTFFSQPGAAKSAPRKAMRFSGVFSTPTLLRRFPIVLVLSSAARIPLPGATIARAVSASFCLSIRLPRSGGPTARAYLAVSPHDAATDEERGRRGRRRGRHGAFLLSAILRGTLRVV